MQNCISFSIIISAGSYDCKWFREFIQFCRKIIKNILQCQRKFRLYWTSGALKIWRTVAFYNRQPTIINYYDKFYYAFNSNWCVTCSTVISGTEVWFFSEKNSLYTAAAARIPTECSWICYLLALRNIPFCHFQN